MDGLIVSIFKFIAAILFLYVVFLSILKKIFKSEYKFAIAYIAYTLLATYFYLGLSFKYSFLFALVPFFPWILTLLLIFLEGLPLFFLTFFFMLNTILIYHKFRKPVRVAGYIRPASKIALIAGLGSFFWLAEVFILVEPCTGGLDCLPLDMLLGIPFQIFYDFSPNLIRGEFQQTIRIYLIVLNSILIYSTVWIFERILQLKNK